MTDTQEFQSLNNDESQEGVKHLDMPLQALNTNTQLNQLQKQNQQDDNPQKYQNILSNLSQNILKNYNSNSTDQNNFNSNSFSDVLQFQLKVDENSFKQQISFQQYQELYKNQEIPEVSEQKFEETDRIMKEEIKQVEDLSQLKSMEESSRQDTDYIRNNEIVQRIRLAIDKVDNEGNMQISFAQLGRVLCSLNVFQILLYDSNYNLQNEQPNNNQARRLVEMNIHELVWKILIPFSEDESFIYTVYLQYILQILQNNFTQQRTFELISNFLNNENLDKETKKIVKNNEKDIKILIEKWKNLGKNIHNDQKIDEKQLNQQVYSNIMHQRENTENNNQGNQIKNQIRKFSTDKSKSTQKLKTQQSYMSTTQSNLAFFHQRQEAQQKKRQDKINQTQQQKENQIMEQCTFKPQIYSTKKVSNKVKENKSAVERLYKYQTKQEKEQNQQQAILLREELQVQECTFQPKINRTKSSMTIQPSSNQVQGYQDAIERLRTGFTLNCNKQQQIQHISYGENYYKNKNKKFNPPSLLQREKKEKKVPFRSIDVNIGGGKKGRIALYENDNPQKLADNFAVTYQLSHDMKCELYKILVQEFTCHHESIENFEDY